MNAGHQKLMLDVLSGMKPERVPFWFMRQAGRYLPEYRELRARKNGFMDMAMDPVSACEITMQPIRRFGMDAAIIFSDILVIPYALGQSLDFVPGEGPKLDALKEAKDIARLGFRDFKSKLSPVYEALSLTRAALKGEGFHHTALIGFAGAPWTVATYMIEGGGSKDFAKVKTWAYSDPDSFSQLIELLSEATAAYLCRQAQAGAEVLQIFDSWAGVLDSSQYKRWVIEPTRKIIQQVRSEYPHIPIIGFPKGSGQNYITYAQETGITAIGLDAQVPTGWAARSLQPLMPVQGNLDPFCLRAGGDALTLTAEQILNDFSGAPFIFNLGHGVNKETPIEHVEKLAQIVKDYRR